MRQSAWRLVWLLAGILPAASCISVSSNVRNSTERRPQASDALTGSSKLALAAFRSTALAAVRQPVTTVKIGVANLWNRPREIFSGNLPLDLTSPFTFAGVPGSPAFETMLDHSNFPAAEPGTLDWLVDGRKFFPALDREIENARKSIHIQVFIFDNDDIAVRYADKLRARATGKLPVHVLFDDLGSAFAHTSAPETLGPLGFRPPADMHDYLQRHSKVSARRVLDPWLACDHTKLLLFDNQSAIVGGMNIGREYYSEWHDLMVRVEGPVVGTLAREFSTAWRKAGPWGDLALLRKGKNRDRRRDVPNCIPLRVLRTDPAENRYEILRSAMLAIRSATQRVWIETPYFAHDDLVAAAAAAARRGVDVRVILPATGDSPIMDSGNLSTANVLIRAGAKIFRYPRMTHMKVMICDNWATVGSANMDTLSMRINRELNLAFADPRGVRGLADAVFVPDFVKSKPMKLADTIAPNTSLAEAIADQL